MVIAIAGTVLLGIGFLTHLLIWHLRLPRNHTSALLLIFSAVPVIAGAPVYLIAAPHWPMPLWETLHLLLFYGALALIYIIYYSVIEQDSILLATYAHIHAAGTHGIRMEELTALFERQATPAQRLALMQHTGIVEQPQAGRFRLTAKGRALAFLFESAERLFGLPREEA